MDDDPGVVWSSPAPMIEDIDISELSGVLVALLHRCRCECASEAPGARLLMPPDGVEPRSIFGRIQRAFDPCRWRAGHHEAAGSEYIAGSRPHWSQNRGLGGKSQKIAVVAARTGGSAGGGRENADHGGR